MPEPTDIQITISPSPEGRTPSDDEQLEAHFRHESPVEGCNWCAVRPLLADLRKVWDNVSGDDDDSESLFVRMWAHSDGYGPQGTIPPQGYDWSGIRDSSPAAVRAMHQAVWPWLKAL